MTNEKLAVRIAENVNRLDDDLGFRPGSDIETSRRWAELVREGEILFYGSQVVEVGLKDIDWTGAHVKHQEWPAQLNRFFWLPHLAAVYEETGDEQLPALARATIDDWIVQHDYGAGAPPSHGDNTLNLSIRVGQGGRGGWWGTLPAFADSAHYDDAFIQRMIESTRGQLACVSHHLTPKGNWRISQLNCLLFCGTVVPGLQEYAPFAVRHLNEAFHRQIHEDGSHEEHNPSYHSWMCRLFTSLWHLGRKRPELGLRIDTERAARMWDYSVYSTAPDGGSCGIHDGGVWRPGPGRIATVSARRKFLEEAGLADRPEWDLERSPSRWFASAGQLYLRDGWAPDATFLAFDATRWGGGHCHLSRMSVNLYSAGRMLLCDPGVFSYEMSDPYAPYGKSTPAHNTVNMGGLSQTDANPDTSAVHILDEYAVIASTYTGGYYPGRYTWGWSEEGRGQGTFGMHSRVLLWLRGRCALVFDVLTADVGQPFAAHWQLPPGPCRVDAGARRAWTGGAESNVLVQVLSAPEDARLVVHEGEEDPLLGWLPGVKGLFQYQPAPLLAVEGQTQWWTELVTMLLPFSGEEPPDVQMEAHARATGGAWGCRVAWPDGREDIVALTPSLRTQIDASGPITSDGSLAVVTRDSGRVTRALLVGGLELDYEGRALIRAERPGAHAQTF